MLTAITHGFLERSHGYFNQPQPRVLIGLPSRWTNLLSALFHSDQLLHQLANWIGDAVSWLMSAICINSCISSHFRSAPSAAMPQRKSEYLLPFSQSAITGPWCGGRKLFTNTALTIQPSKLMVFPLVKLLKTFMSPFFYRLQSQLLTSSMKFGSLSPNYDFVNTRTQLAFMAPAKVDASNHEFARGGWCNGSSTQWRQT